MKLITVKQLSNAINIKESTLYAWSSRGLIPSHKLNGLLRFNFDEIQEWINSSRVISVPFKIPKKKSLKMNEVDILIKKAIASVKGQGYNFLKQRGNQTAQTRRKEEN